MTGENTGPGVVLWITGLSGAGKSVIARRTFEILKSRAPNVVLVDGDEFRAVLGDDLRHHPEDRLRNAYRIARFCRFLSGQGIHVVCATMSLFHECRAWNRAHLPAYCEVYVRVPLDVVVARDPKGLYGRALAGQIGDVVGVNLPFEEPSDPDLIVDNREPTEDFTGIARRILAHSSLSPAID